MIFEVSADSEGLRLDKFLMKLRGELELSNISRSLWSQLIDKGVIKVNAKPVKRAYKLKIGDKVEVPDNLCELLREIWSMESYVGEFSQDLKSLPSDLKPEIIYEDSRLMVVNKPAGLLTHRNSPSDPRFDLLSWATLYVRANGGSNVFLVHRLDKDTSGCVVLAKDKLAQIFLRKEFEDRRVLKLYLAVVHGKLKAEHIVIDAPLWSSRVNPMGVEITSGGRRALTEIYRLESFREYDVLLIRLHTGRKHQIRVHLKAIGHPVVGDKLYGVDSGKFRDSLNGHALHAWYMRFRHPSDKRYLSLSCKPSGLFYQIVPPEVFEHALERAERLLRDIVRIDL